MNHFQPIAQYKPKPREFASDIMFVTDGTIRCTGYCMAGSWYSHAHKTMAITHYAPLIFPPLPAQPEFELHG